MDVVTTTCFYFRITIFSCSCFLFWVIYNWFRPNFTLYFQNYNYFFEDESTRLEEMSTLDRLLESLSLDK